MSDERRPSTRESRREASAIRSEELRRALDDAAKRKPSRLGELLARHSGLPGPKPNLALAQAVAEDLATRPPREALLVLAPLADDDAAPDTAHVFLPMVAAWGYVALHGQAESWRRLATLGADERAPVRLSTGHALASFAARTPQGGDRLVGAMAAWLGDDGFPVEDRDVRWGALATALDAIAERGALTTVSDRARLLELVSRWITELADAPRAAERSDARRRSLASISVAAALFAKDVHGVADGVAWLEAECARARHPDLRRAFEGSLERLAKRGASERVEVLTRLKGALESSAKPPRDPTLERKGTRRRGQG
ncbi:MAG: hypothetical protein K1X94_31840 [Sandaracinaceae bacterium]|jgi:hypothetical protein|nr:hypothetical protein [Sandaracinaceae bacterium]